MTDGKEDQRQRIRELAEAHGLDVAAVVPVDEVLGRIEELERSNSRIWRELREIALVVNRLGQRIGDQPIFLGGDT